MHPSHSVRLVVAGVLAIGAVVLMLNLTAPPSQSGSFLTWATKAEQQAQSTPSAPPGMSRLLAPAPSSSPAGVWGMLRIPLSALFRQLNAETRDTAHGQYTILQELERGLRDRVDSFLNWVTARH